MQRLAWPLVLLSAFLLPLALPNDLYTVGNPLLGMVCLAPLFVGLTLSGSYRLAAALGAVFGALSSFLAHYWLIYFGDFSVWTVTGVVLGYTLFGLLLGPVLRGVSTRLPRYRVFALAAAWTVWEYIKSTGFLGFPWGLISHPFTMILPLLQISDTTGVWGVSMLIALVNATVASMLLEGGGSAIGWAAQWVWRDAVMVGLLGIVVLSYGVFQMTDQPEVQDRLDIVLVQHNADPWADDGPQAVITAQELTRKAVAGGAPDLVVWSETILPLAMTEESVGPRLSRYPPASPMSQFLQELGVPLLLGSPFSPGDVDGYQNAALLLSPDGRLISYYGKQHLVPVAERIPFWSLGPVRWFFREKLGLSQGWTPGTGSRVMTVALAGREVIQFGTPVCFEDSFGDVCRRFVRDGADVLINLTNVSWSQRESAMIQMLVAARFRAIENRRLLLRATNGGVTAVIDTRGRITLRLELFRPDSLRTEVPLYRQKRLTPYTRWGDWFPIALFLGLTMALCLRMREPS